MHMVVTSPVMSVRLRDYSACFAEGSHATAKYCPFRWTRIESQS